MQLQLLLLLLSTRSTLQTIRGFIERVVVRQIYLLHLIPFIDPLDIANYKWFYRAGRWVPCGMEIYRDFRFSQQTDNIEIVRHLTSKGIDV